MTADAVAAEERATDHNVRALVNVLQRELPASVRHLVHVGATSYDITDTANALRYRAALRNVIVPLLIRLERALIELTEREADTAQVGRTHGQYASPVTFGFAMAEYVARLGKSIVGISGRAGDLRGKLAGAVGAYNATSLLVDDALELERAVLRRLELKPSESATPRSSSRSTCWRRSWRWARHSASSPIWLMICATCSGRKSTRCVSRSAVSRSDPPPCRRNAIRGTVSTSRACGRPSLREY